MHRYTDGTPCPPFAPTLLGQPYQHYPNPYTQSYSLSTMYEDTQDIQYTTELQAQQLRKAKPRRRVSLAPSARQSIAIHEDATSMTGSNVAPAEGSTMRGLGKSSSKRESLVSAQPRRRRVSAILSDKLATASETSATTSQDRSETAQATASVLKKEARRRTIYIPEDTTVFTIHPGASMADKKKDRKQRGRSPDVGFDLVTLSEEDEEPLRPSMRQTSTQKKASQKSFAAAPKRAPLHQSRRPLQSVSFAEDIPGAPTGKENSAPSSIYLSSKSGKRTMDDLAKARLNIGGVRNATPDKKAASSQAKMVHSLNEFKSPKKRTGSDSILAYSPQPTRMRISKNESKASMRASEVVKTAGEQLFTRARTMPPLDETTKVVPKVSRATQAPPPKVPFLLQKAQEQSTKYQVLSEDLVHPELYEDHWLDYQEIALSQLVNSIFEPHETFRQPADQTGLRKQLLALYHDPQIPLLHKRLQASLLYGALKIPKDILAKTSRIKDDVGLKKRFLTLFSQSYDLAVLQAAAEVIVGREMSKPRRSGNMTTSTMHTRSTSSSSTDAAGNRLSTGSNASDNPEREARTARRAVERFLDTFLLKHEDAVRSKGTIANIARSNAQTTDDFGSQGWSWRRTVLRSLMLVSLLDKAKSKGLVKDCLFQTSSPHKSSAAVLTALGGLLLPSLGDIARPLSHLNYSLETVQYPLQEYQYQIINLAADLRDGVMLTRLVELVLFNKSADGSAGPYNSSDQTMTISMPTGEMLTSSWTEDPAEAWILSQHLKFPCAGRPQKVYNVQIALCALTTLGGAATKASYDITADDIVDGHREKTLSLLWAIVGHCGLSALVNWQELKREIQHFRIKAKRGNDITAGFLDHTTPMSPEPNLSLKSCSKLLLSWAQSITSLQGLKVTNLTTSFANPKVLECIVDAYLPYFPHKATTRPVTLPGKLRALGCSPSFTTLFTPNNGTPIPSQSLTLTTLTYLSSRLLPLSLTHRAATTIQRVYRLHLVRREMKQRIKLAKLAHHCALVVGARERVVNAATVLQRAWRKVLDKRIDALVSDVTNFQSVARSWLARERVRSGGRAKERKVRGGW